MDSEQTPVDAPAAEPFEPQPAQFSGCGKPVVLGCVVLLALLAIGLVLLISQSPKLLAWSLDNMKQQVEAGLPEDLDPGRREALEAAFDGAAAAFREGRVSPDTMSHVQALTAELPKPGETLEVERVDRIIDLLGKIAATPAPGRQSSLEPVPVS